VPRTRAYLEKAMARLKSREASIPDYADLLDAPPARRSA